MVFPAGTPREIVHRWHGDIVNIIALPDVRQRLAAMSFEPIGNSPEEFGALIESEIPKWRRVIEGAKLK